MTTNNLDNETGENPPHKINPEWEHLPKSGQPYWQTDAKGHFNPFSQADKDIERTKQEGWPAPPEHIKRETLRKLCRGDKRST